MIPVFGQFQDPGSHPSWGEANRMLCNVCGCETGSAAEHNHHMMMHVVDASSMGQSAGWGAGAPSAHMPSHLMHHGHGPAVHHHGGSRHQECGKISRRKGICVSRSPVREQRDSLQPKKRSCYGTAARDEFVLHSQLAQLRSPDLAGTLRSQNRWDEDGMSSSYGSSGDETMSMDHAMHHDHAHQMRCASDHAVCLDPSDWDHDFSFG